MAMQRSLSERNLLTEPGAAFMRLEGSRLADDRNERGDETATANRPERFEVIVIGAGQAGLSAGYHLARRGADFVILEAAQRIGDQWRNRWDSLRLFTPAKFDGLDGMRFPGPREAFPRKDEMADYLEAYAQRFDLPVRLRMRVDRLERSGDQYVVTAGDRVYIADRVIVAAASYQAPKIPGFASELDPAIRQIHSSEYRNPSQLRPGPALIVGAGNSGAEIAVDIAGDRRIWLAGRDVGAIPFDIEGRLSRLFLARLVLRGVFHRILSDRTPLGRKVRPHFLAHGGPLIRTKSPRLAAAGIDRVARVAGARDGLPLLDDSRVLDAANVIWCTGFHPGLSWIGLPIFGEDGRPRHSRGIVPDAPGLCFVGLHFQSSPSSTMVHGVGRDARRIVDHLMMKVPATG